MEPNTVIETDKWKLDFQYATWKTSKDAIEQQLAMIDTMGRLCHKSESKVKPYDPGFISRLIGWHHESVLEHLSFSVILHTDIPVVRQLVRHRLASPTEQSARYVNFAGGKHKFEFIVPHDLTDQTCKGNLIYPTTANPDVQLLVDNINNCVAQYESVINKGGKPQDARRRLPLCMATNYGLTANLREWRHIFRERLTVSAEPQTRNLVLSIYDFVKENWPFLVEDIVPVINKDHRNYNLIYDPVRLTK